MAIKNFNLKGVRPSPEDQRDVNYHLTRFVSFDEPLPKVYLPDSNPVRNQGQHGSCVGFASASAFENAVNGSAKKLFKPKDTYYRCIVADYVTKNTVKVDCMAIINDSTIVQGVQGIISFKLPQGLIDAGNVRVKITAENYRCYSCYIDFKQGNDVTRRVLLVPLKNKLGLLCVEEILEDNVPAYKLPKLHEIQDCLMGLIQCLLDFFNPKKSSSSVMSKLFSPKWVYSKCKELDGEFSDTGTYPRQACKVILEKGCACEYSCPYNEPVPEDLSKATSLASAAYLNKASIYNRVYTVEEVKRAIYNGFGVFFAVKNADILAYNMPFGQFDLPKWAETPGWNAHAMHFIGWDETGLVIKNSWGVNWGLSGKARMPYSSRWFAEAVFEIWAVKA